MTTETDWLSRQDDSWSFYVEMISFVIPSYNQARFIGECLDSIVAQRLEEGSYEVIVVDGGSTDGTVEILREHSVVTQWVSEPDGGHYDGVNKGISMSRGELIAWINSDDFYFEGAIARILDFIKAHPDADIYYGNAAEVDERGCLIREYAVEEWDYQRLIDRCILCQPATIVRKSVFERYGGLSAECLVAVDLEYWLRVGEKARFLRAPVKVAASRLWGETKSSNEQLAMQEDALFFGHLYGRRWSTRRIGSVAEARMLKRFPKLSQDRSVLGRAVFHGLRFLYSIAINTQCRLGGFRLRKRG